MTNKPAGYQTFDGVFRPITLTILGAMLYLREGWLVGNCGLLGALLVIVAGYAISGTTALSLASIATNVRVKPGGAFAIISQSLGLEAGGAIGIPLYIAQTMSVAMYLYAFSEGWNFLFPDHQDHWVVIVVFIGLVALTLWSSELAFKAQAIMLLVVGLAISSAALGLFSTDTLLTPQWVGTFPEATPLEAFKIFFPACTGIMVGAGMSGSLSEPRKSIPSGTLAAWGFTMVIYILGAIWYSLVATPAELVQNKLVMVDRALFGPMILIGLVCSTLMAALSSLVAAPKLLQAMAEQGVVPLHRHLQKTSSSGQPRIAIVVTAVLAGLGLLSGSLDAIAPIITSCFLLTYLAINLVVLLEQRLAMISFRPTFPIAKTIPLLGVILCASATYVSSPRGGVIEISSILVLYGVLVMRQLKTPWETVRSGITVNLAAWAAQRAVGIKRTERSWQPDLLIPVSHPEQVAELLPFVQRLCERNGSVRWLGLGDAHGLGLSMHTAVERLTQLGIFATATTIHTPSMATGVQLALDIYAGGLFPPNLVVLERDRLAQKDVDDLLHRCKDLQVGAMLYLSDPDMPLVGRGDVNIWVSRPQDDWQSARRLQNLDLPILIAYLLTSRPRDSIQLLTALTDPAEREHTRTFLRQLVEMARLPASTERTIYSAGFNEALERAPQASVHILGMPLEPQLDRLDRLRHQAGGPCIFLLDSGRESILA